MELVPLQVSLERNFKQSSPAAFDGPHLFGKYGALATAIRDAEAATLLRTAALKEGEMATSRSQTRALSKNVTLFVRPCLESYRPKNDSRSHSSTHNLLLTGAP